MDLLTANPTFSCQLYGVRCQVKPFKCNQIEKGKLLIIKKVVLGTNSATQRNYSSMSENQETVEYSK